MTWMISKPNCGKDITIFCMPRDNFRKHQELLRSVFALQKSDLVVKARVFQAHSGDCA